MTREQNVGLRAVAVDLILDVEEMFTDQQTFLSLFFFFFKSIKKMGGKRNRGEI